MEPVPIPNKLPILTIINEVLLPGAPIKLGVTSSTNRALMKEVLSKGLKVIGVIPLKDELDDMMKLIELWIGLKDMILEKSLGIVL